MRILTLMLSFLLIPCWAIAQQFTPKEDGNLYPYRMYKTTVKGNIDIAYIDEGQGNSTLLFLHGMGGYHQIWKKNVDELSQYYRCIAIDLPGYGQSSKGEYAFSARFYTDVVEAFIAKLKLQKVVIVGHSLGGQVAVLTALSNIPAIEKLVLIAPSGLKEITSVGKFWFLKAAEPDIIKNRPDRTLKWMFKRSYASGQIPTDAQFMLDHRINMKNRPAYLDYYSDLSYALTKATVEELIIDQLSDVQVPVLVLWGEEDRAIPSSLAAVARQKIPNCQVKRLSPCGHMVIWECSTEVNNFIDKFIGR